MAYPPRSRRTRVRRRSAFALAALAVVTSAAGFTFLHDERFRGRSEPLSGTPVTLRVEHGVARSETRLVRTGIRAAARYMRGTFGRTVHGPVEAQVAGRGGCGRLTATDGIPIGEAELGLVCIDTASLSWQWLALKDRTAAVAIAAHEYTHVLQAELGCLPRSRTEEPRWLVEGMASHVAWEALVAAGRATRADVAQAIRGGGAFDFNLEPLRSYETDGGRDPEYSLWQAATAALVAEAARRGAVSGRVPEIALVSYCRRVGHGTPWRAAFRRSFGLTTERFYARFEWARLRGMLTKRITLAPAEGAQ